MIIKSISLKNFRNLAELNMELGEQINIFYGGNAQGKTNFLESVYFCATGRSHRTHIDKELILFNESDAYIQLYFDDDGIKDKISVHLKRDFKKGIALNNMPIKKLGDLLGRLIVVIFSPEDLQLVKNGPAERRKFMDTEICQISNIYYYELGSYYRVLKQRNNLLKDIIKHRENTATLSVWDEQLAKHGEKIYWLRKDFIENLSEISSQIYSDITNHKETLAMYYKPSVTPENFLEKLRKNTDRDILLGSTSTGIHKDDISILIDGFDVRTYGSQGQQRTASLCAKLAEIELIYKQKQRKPVLLLDDVLSELDESRQTFLLNFLKDIQTIITCTGVEDIVKKISKNNKISTFYVNKGTIV